MATNVWLALVGVLVVGLPLAISVGARFQQRGADDLVDRLVGSARPRSIRSRADARSTDVPAPVMKYLGWALPEGREIHGARLKQRGTLRTGTDTDRWMSFEADQVVAPHAPGFVWNARVTIALLVHLAVRDAFVAGAGSGQIALWAAFPIASDGGTPEMNSGALHRFLAEAAWYPSALRPSEHLHWRAIDDSAALATLSVGDLEVSLEFRFGDPEITAVYTSARWGSFPDGYDERPWEGHFRNYRLIDGVRVPTEGEVGWYVNGEWACVWKGTVADITYEFSE